MGKLGFVQFSVQQYSMAQQTQFVAPISMRSLIKITKKAIDIGSLSLFAKGNKAGIRITGANYTLEPKARLILVVENQVNPYKQPSDSEIHQFILEEEVEKERDKKLPRAKRVPPCFDEVIALKKTETDAALP